MSNCCGNAGYTTGRDCQMSLATAYKNRHSIIRSQLFFVELTDIPLFVASQMVRSHVGVQFFQRSKRTDRGGEDFSAVCEDIALALSENGSDYGHLAVASNLAIQDILKLPNRFDRYAPTDLAFIINADALMNMSHKRLCTKASQETREIWQTVCAKIKDIDPALYQHLVPQCLYRGGICGEPRSCGYCKTEIFKKALTFYKANFV